MTMFVADQRDAARRVARNVHHPPARHLITVVQQQVRGGWPDPDQPSQKPHGTPTLLGEFAAGQDRGVERVDGQAGSSAPAELGRPGDVVEVPVGEDDERDVLRAHARLRDAAQNVPGAAGIDDQQPLLCVDRVAVRDQPARDHPDVPWHWG
jgi:hypothetical protein